ncbi:MAG: hypothetical protein JNN08_29055 [Bryobacterales bacterium]|nr:hypothetical protein [Bryobacterales bacterium]
MKTLLCVASLLVILATPATPQPVVQQGGVLNAASYAIPGLPSYGIAQGSLFVVFGLGLGPSPLRKVETLPYPTQFAGTSIRVSVAGVHRDAVIVYTSERQVAAILPSDTPTGDGTLAVTYEGRTSAPVAVPVVGSTFGIFTRNQAGSGPAIVQNYISPADQPVNALTDAARPGQTMILWGTGLGPVDFDDSAVPQVRNLNVDVTVLVGGKSAKVLYQGRSPQFPGIDQINFELPGDVATGCHVPLAVRAGGVVSNFTTIAVSSQGKVCSDVTAYAAGDIAKAQGDGELKVGVINLVRWAEKGLGAIDVALAEFDRYDYSTLLKVLEIGSGPRMLEAGIPPFGTCNVLTGRNSSGSPWGAAEDPILSFGLDAGPEINISGPLGSKQIRKRNDRPALYGGYIAGSIPGIANFGPQFFAPGTYVVQNGSGTTAVGTFLGTTTIPSPPEWTNQDSINAVPRSQNLLVTWSGGDSAREYIYVLGISNDLTSGASGAFLCTELPSAGRLTVPSFVLATLPPSGMQSGRPTATLEVGLSPTQESARLQAPGLDVAHLIYAISTWKTLSYQ